jgi:hypothetical protein
VGETRNPCRTLEQGSLGKLSSVRHRTKLKYNIITLARYAVRLESGFNSGLSISGVKHMVSTTRKSVAFMFPKKELFSSRVLRVLTGTQY